MYFVDSVAYLAEVRLSVHGNLKIQNQFDFRLFLEFELKGNNAIMLQHKNVKYYIYTFKGIKNLYLNFIFSLIFWEKFSIIFETPKWVNKLDKIFSEWKIMGPTYFKIIICLVKFDPRFGKYMIILK